MAAKEHFAQPFAAEKSGLRTLQFYFFQFLPALALKLRGGKSSFPREFIYYLQQRLSMLAQSGKRNADGILAGADRQISSQPAQKFFQFTTGMLCSTRAHHSRSHFRQSRAS